MVDPDKFTSDNTRLVQVACLAGIALLSLLNSVADIEFFVFLLMVVAAGFMVVTIGPIYLETLTADTSPLPKTGRVGLRAAEAAAMAGMATAIVVLFAGLGAMAEEGSIITFALLILAFLVQGVAALSIAVGVGLTNLLRNGDVVLEAPPPPKPKAAPQPQAYQQQAYGPAPQGYPPQAEAPPAQAPPQAHTEEQPAGDPGQAGSTDASLDWPDKPSQ